MPKTYQSLDVDLEAHLMQQEIASVIEDISQSERRMVNLLASHREITSQMETLMNRFMIMMDNTAAVKSH